MTSRTGIAAALAVALFTVGACKRGDNESATVSRGQVESSALRVTDVELGKAIGANNELTDKTDDFRPNETIYAVVKTSGNTPGTLTARWTYQDGQTVDSTTRSISPAGDAVTEFHIAKPSGFPVGNYKVEILLGGQVAESEEFEVKQ